MPHFLLYYMNNCIYLVDILGKMTWSLFDLTFVRWKAFQSVLWIWYEYHNYSLCYYSMVWYLFDWIIVINIDIDRSILMLIASMHLETSIQHINQVVVLMKSLMELLHLHMRMNHDQLNLDKDQRGKYNRMNQYKNIIENNHI